MTSFIQFLRILFVAFNLHFKKNEKYYEMPGVFISREMNLRKEKKKVWKQKPPKINRRRRDVVHQKYRSTKPKDVRFSNQQKLRRMYRNS